MREESLEKHSPLRRVLDKGLDFALSAKSDLAMAMRAALVAGLALSTVPACGTDPNAGMEDAFVQTPDSDAGQPDAAQPGLDAAQPGLDAAQPGEDAAQPGPDAAQPGLDAAQPGEDAAQPGEDAAQPGPDAAEPGSDAGADGGVEQPPAVWGVDLDCSSTGPCVSDWPTPYPLTFGYSNATSCTVTPSVVSGAGSPGSCTTPTLNGGAGYAECYTGSDSGDVIRYTVSCTSDNIVFATAYADKPQQ